MHFNILAFVIPLVLAFMFLEHWISSRRGYTYFSFAGTVNNLNIGIAERLSDLFITGVFFFVYDFLHRHFAIFQITPSFLNWVLLLLATDFLWYWYHRMGHEVNLFWGAHVVHHQSEEFNYSVSARITVFQAVIRTLFWSFLPVIGFPASMITTILMIHGLYPFFTHTRVIGKLGWLEYIFVTPSHHRVHHASDEQYLDKNYGDIFIFWDKIFGTFKEEQEEPSYGLTKPLNSHSFLWQHFHFWLEMLVAVGRAKTIREKIKIIFGKPDNIDPNIRPVLERKFKIYGNPSSAGIELNRYVLWQIISSLLVLFLLILFEHHIHLGLQIAVGAVILSTVINCGAILERRKWIFHMEVIRAVLGSIVLFLIFPSPQFVVMAVVVLLVLVGYFETIKEGYFKLVYREAEG